MTIPTYPAKTKPLSYVSRLFYLCNAYDSIDAFVRIANNNSTKEGVDIMSVTATELKNNLGKYLLLSATEDIYITKNGKVVAKDEKLGTK